MPLADIIRQRVHPLVTSNRTLVYSFLSTLAVSIAIGNALRNHSNFYSVAVYLSKSSRSLLILANFGFLLALLSGRILQQIFFGPLSPAEVERLYDRIWYFVTESLLAFTIFRDEFDVPFAIMFGFLLFVKCFHWLLSDRIESMDQRPYPGPPMTFHIRVNCLFVLLWLTDFAMFAFAVESTLTQGVGGTVLFASEYAILMASALNSVAKYVLSCVELRRARTRGGETALPWEDKSVYNFYIELTTDFLKLTTYLLFFVVVVAAYGIPLNIVRDVYMTARSFVMRLRAFQRYRSATRDMDARYPNATEADLPVTGDRTCIICREEMVPVATQEGGVVNNLPTAHDGPNMTPKKLPCGHTFHFQCLRSWLERQQSCPTCRRNVLEEGQPGQGQGQQRNAIRRQAPPPNMPLQWNFGRMNPQGQQQVNNQPPGLLARLIGAAAGPPQVPGQFAPLPAGAHPIPNNAFPPNNVNGLPPRNIGTPPYPYQAPPGPGQVPPPAFVFGYPWVLGGANPGGLAQAPMLQGFYRPDGLWQPWPAQPARRPPPTPATRTAESATPASMPHPAPLATPAPASGASADVTRPEQASTAPSTTAPLPRNLGATTPSETRSFTPRDAAVQAALRRLNPSNATSTASPAPSSQDAGPTATPTQEQPISPTPTTPAPPPASAAPPTNLPASVPVAMPVTQSNPGASTSAPAATTAQPTTTVPPAVSAGRASTPRTDVPNLIPLYDFAQPPADYRSAYSPFSQHIPQPTVPPRMTPPTPTNMPRGPFPLRPRYPYAQPLYNAVPSAPLGQLPERLTDEQLAQLDRLTREAIDERLRILTDVSGTVWRCVEELTRMRSVLPAPSAPRAVPGGAASGKTNSATSSSVSPNPRAQGTSSNPPAAAAVPTGPSSLPAEQLARGDADVAGSTDVTPEVSIEKGKSRADPSTISQEDAAAASSSEGEGSMVDSWETVAPSTATPVTSQPGGNPSLEDDNDSPPEDPADGAKRETETQEE
ncbi:hypothetical protein PUNSTDRAFT_119134 [Punctularia strigosozonata HHB-11173 SS5]|uniref:uncharacterized protein n=1 Tax=Punctularia strigosozonata (strain HHB-11173) TaxID=741275 RepID=UPI000441851F|nr:uncharacterized protein PUNSTDRAFT_119134 [Punctularia strigosozonata HHB-11173 SS5]EIN11941.1 hypothetical protein PUNSTDRAFT_119134 [Punctularia strigosozonata HHB-11173 SS5]